MVGITLARNSLGILFAIFHFGFPTLAALRHRLTRLTVVVVAVAPHSLPALTLESKLKVGVRNMSKLTLT